MRLCFDATRFGCGLDGAVELAVRRGLSCVEYSFQPFATGAKAKQALDKSEKDYLKQVRRLCETHNVNVACLNLDFCLEPEDKKSAKRFIQMAAKLAAVADAVGCRRISLSMMPGKNGDWKQNAEDALKAVSDVSSEHNVRVLLRLATPAEFRGHSLKEWKAMEPQDWRDLVSSVPDLSLSFSPADCIWLGIDYLKILSGLASAIDHVEAHDIEINRDLLTDSGMFGPLWWRYRMPGKGQVDWRQLIEALKLYDFQGTLSIHLDDEFIGDEVEDLGDALDNSIRVLAPLVRD
ncbi:MAG TPA: TIM barrel protein [Candidatus Obscuribacterales bacterium]